MSPQLRTILTWVGIALLLILIINFNSIKSDFSQNTTEIPYSTFLNQLSEGNIDKVNIQGQTIVGTRRDGQNFSTFSPSDPTLVQRLIDNGVTIQAEPLDSGISFLGILIQWFPMLLLIGVWFYVFKQMQSGGNRVMGFGKSKARLQGEEEVKVTFKDVAGIDEAKTELEEIVDFLSNPKKFQKLGGKIPRGVLLIGPPGTGKTLLARAVAGEAKVPFYTISGSDFVEMFVGVGASRVRDMFDQAKKSSPCILFIDELDAVGRHRGAGLGGGNDEREQTLNQLLVEMDGFETNESVILIAATNRPDVLDPALLRPGRFDRQVVVSNPDINGREQILLIHLRKVLQAPDINPRTIARGTPGFSGADLANLVNEAALLAARYKHRAITASDMEEAKDKIMMGSERKSLVVSEEEKKLTAYHEAGHALAAVHCKASDPIHKVTIVPRGRSLGMVMRLPEKDELSMSRDKLEANMIVAMGGRLAEEMVFGKNKVTTGAAQDISMVTTIAKKMVTEWGMSDKLGRLKYNESQEEVFLGHSVARHQNVSEATASIIDQETRRLVEESEDICREILKKHIKQLHLIAKTLLIHETLSGDDIKNVLKTGKYSKKIKASETDKNPRKPRSKLPSVKSKQGQTQIA